MPGLSHCAKFYGDQLDHNNNQNSFFDNCHHLEFLKIINFNVWKVPEWLVRCEGVEIRLVPLL